MSYSRWSDEVIETAVEHRPACYTDMDAETYAASVKQMHDDLSRLAHEDGCIAAAWALESVRRLAEDLRGRKEAQAYMDRAFHRMHEERERMLALTFASGFLMFIVLVAKFFFGGGNP